MKERISTLKVLVFAALVILAACLIECCTPSKSEQYLISFDEAPWDVEFDDDHIFDQNETFIYFYKDTIYNEDTKGILMYKVRKDFTLPTLDERGRSYITKSYVVEFEKSVLIRKKLE